MKVKHFLAEAGSHANGLKSDGCVLLSRCNVMCVVYVTLWQSNIYLVILKTFQ